MLDYIWKDDGGNILIILLILIVGFVLLTKCLGQVFVKNNILYLFAVCLTENTYGVLRSHIVACNARDNSSSWSMLKTFEAKSIWKMSTKI